MSELEVNFDDVTIIETDGEFEEVRKLLDPEEDLELWLVKSQFGIIGSGFDCFGQIDFWHTGESVINAYMTNFDSEMIPSDLLYLNQWLKERGWDVVVDEHLRMYNFDFWARFDGMVEDDEMLDFEYDDEEDEEMDFVEYQQKMMSYKKPKMKGLKITDLKEFKDHKNDHYARDESERKIF